MTALATSAAPMLAPCCDRPGAGAAADPDQRAPSAPRCHRLDRQDRGRAHRQRFVEVTVGDPEVADVTPLTDRSLSILGKKIGTTRVSVYGEGKKLIGVFDVEVFYDTSQLQTEISRRFRRRHPGDLGQRPHHAVRHRARRPDGRQGGADRQPVRPGRHQLGASAAAAAGHAGGALRRSHAPGRPRARRAVERVRPEHARQHRQPHAGGPASDHHHGRPVPAAGRHGGGRTSRNRTAAVGDRRGGRPRHVAAVRLPGRRA